MQVTSASAVNAVQATTSQPLADPSMQAAPASAAMPATQASDAAINGVARISSNAQSVLSGLQAVILPRFEPVIPMLDSTG